MPLTYLDQNALIDLGRKSRALDFRKKLDKAIGSGLLTVVVSVLNLIEAANTPKTENAFALADFIDSLNPLWLRRDTRTIDVCENFYKFANVGYEVPGRITDRATALAGDGVRPGGYDVTARDFVGELMRKPEYLDRLKVPAKDCVDALVALRKRTVTREEIKRVNERIVRVSMPAYTPGGLEFGRELREEYIRQVDVGSIPTIAIECAISDQARAEHDYADRNTLLDKFHLVYALPCVDEIVSRDKFFRRIYPAAKSTGHVKATLVCNEEFLRRFQ